MFIVLKMLSYDEQENRIDVDQVSFCLGKGILISFEEAEGKNIFFTVRERIRNNKGRIRKMGADYLMYSLMDTVVDSYFGVLEKIGDRIEDLEEEVMTEPSESVLHQIHQMKREMIFLRKSVWPLREVITSLERSPSEIIGDAMHLYFRDVYDHTIRVAETIETFRDILTSMLDIYLSGVSNRLNNVMKVLTIIATIFMPLTFLAGLYGMNFKYMPELEWRWGYPTVLVVMAFIGISMVTYFKKKKWL